jgi:DNA-binding NarL/FixJ family response regulator
LLRYGLEEDERLKVVGEAGGAQEAIDAISELQPDVVLLDLSMPGMDGLEAIPLLRQVAPQMAIVVFSGFAAERMREPALSLGAARYVEKGEPLETVRATVHEVATAA